MSSEIANLRLRRSVGLSVNRLLPELVGVRVRTTLLRLAGVSIGPRSIVGGPMTIVGRGELRVGRDCWINGGCHFDVSADVSIGNRVALAQGVLLVTNTHELGGPHQRAGAVVAKPVTIGDGCWLGAHVIVLPGVTIGVGSVIGAGAVVTADVEPNVLAGGVPARTIKRLAQ